MTRVRWAMPSWTRPPATPMSPPTCCARWWAHWSGWRCRRRNRRH